jgi:hypothetical protein
MIIEDKVSELEEMLKRLAYIQMNSQMNNEFFDYFPEYNGYELIPIFSTLYFPDEAIKYLSRNKIYAMGIKEDTMDILNFDDVKV